LLTTIINRKTLIKNECTYLIYSSNHTIEILLLYKTLYNQNSLKVIRTSIIHSYLSEFEHIINKSKSTDTYLVRYILFLFD